VPTVYNRHYLRQQAIPPPCVYVGRPTVWGNRHPITPEICDICNKRHGRQEAVDKFREDMAALKVSDPALYHNMLHPLRGQNLACWCAPKPCHADVLLELANPPRIRYTEPRGLRGRNGGIP
jgi:hypothetical protein